SLCAPQGPFPPLAGQVVTKCEVATVNNFAALKSCQELKVRHYQKILVLKTPWCILCPGRLLFWHRILLLPELFFQYKPFLFFRIEKVRRSYETSLRSVLHHRTGFHYTLQYQ